MSDPLEQAPPFITRVQVTNFRSIASCDVELGPLVVLLGPNASGKSNFLDAIRFVVDALSDSPHGAVERRGGLDALLHRSAQGSAPYFEITLHFAPHGSSTYAGKQAAATYTVRVGPHPSGSGDLAILHEHLGLPDDAGADSFQVSMEPDGTRARDGLRDAVLSADGLWFAVVGSSDKAYAEFFRALTAPRFYELDSDVLRSLHGFPGRGGRLGSRGEYVGWVLGKITERAPRIKDRLDGYLGAVVPSALGVDQRREGRYYTIEARFWTGEPVLGYWDAVNNGEVAPGDPNVLLALPETLSEGTLLATGLLVALFQPNVVPAGIPFTAIEEPETAIHPSYVVALFDALHDASLGKQVIITTQSAELLESEYAQLDQLRLVENLEGATYISEVDEGTRQVVEQGLATIGELHRQRQLKPTNLPSPRGDHDE